MEEYKKMLELTDGSKSETLSVLKKPKPRSKYARPKKYKLEQDALYLKSTSHKSNEVDGIPKSDVEVLSSMLCPQCLTQFEIHRNYRTLQFIHDLSMHSHNISNLMPVIPYVANFIAARLADGNCFALALAVLANVSMRRAARLKIGSQRGLLSNIVKLLSMDHPFAPINAASCIRNLSVERKFARRFALLEAPVHIINLLKNTPPKNLEHQIILSYACANLTFEDEKNREMFIQHEMAPLLLKLTGTAITNDKYCAVRAAAADALANLAIDNDFGASMLKARGAASLFVMATHEDQLMTWHSAGGALQNFNALDDFKKSKIQSQGLAALSRMNPADVIRAMPLLRKAKEEDVPTI